MSKRQAALRIDIGKRSVEALKAADQEFIAWDKELSAFGVRISPGSTKTFLIKYRFAGQQRKMALGRFGPVTADEARKSAKAAQGQIARGVDPQAARDSNRTSNTVAEAWAKFTAYRSKLPFRKRPPWKSKTIDEYAKAWRNHIRTPLGHRPLASVMRTDIERIRDKLGEKGNEVTANRVCAYLGAFFSWSIDKGLYPHADPTRGIDEFVEKARERVLDDDELLRLWNAIESYSGNVFVKAALALYLFTSCRREEIITLRWEDVFLDDAYLRLRDAKTGDRNVPLPAEAVELLKRLPRMAGIPDKDGNRTFNPFVICGQKTGAHLVDFKKSWATVLKRAGIEGCTIHDLRRTYGSVALAGGLDIYALSKLLGHKSVATTQRAYAFMPSATLRAASTQVAGRMSETLAGKHGKIVQLRRVQS